MSGDVWAWPMLGALVVALVVQFLAYVGFLLVHEVEA